jgi:hypothetical protein
MKQVEIISAVHWDGHHRDCGDVIQVKESDADWLISRQKAKPYTATIAPVVNRVIEVETSEAPKLTKRTWKRKDSV